ncbi:hypothetical protein B0T18DRAFT_408586 [Schizothecium vesticola]|uniref:Cardiolipin synthase N-terminal domain-containing protein n=1 Tax=Schizothecium vesticola TaxID=314040 RepID=A0AA40F352_9PEZI|nr:hypothetical protein B0T18DRAFT_408586 [Schizothecium vesticola]
MTALLLLSHLLLATFASALPTGDVTTTTAGNSWQYGTGGGILGLIVLVLDIIVFVEVIKSTRPPLHKLLWSLLVFFFPIGGLIIYYLFSNRASYTNGGGYEALP